MTPQIKERIEKISRGEVPEGYKETKSGIIPNDWDVKRIEEVCKVNPTRSKNINGDVTFVGMTDVSESASLENQNIVSLDTVKNGLTPFEKGDILVAKITPCFENGKGAYTTDLQTEFGFGSTEFHVLRSNINPRFTFYNTITYRFRKKLEREMTGSAGQQRVQTDSLSKYPLSVPSLVEQERIADILTIQYKVIELKEKLIVEKQAQKKYLMQQLLTGKKRLKGFDGEWETVKLKYILRERKTYCQKGEEYPHVTLSKDGVCPKTDRYDRDHLVKDEEKEYKITYKGDICYNPANLKFGVICENTFGDGIFSPIYVTYEVSPEVDRAFIAHYLMRWDFINAVRKYEEGTVYERMAVKSSDFLKYSFKIPSLEEQKAISKVLSIVDKEIELLQQELEQEKQKKKALMQLLLTGIVRVKTE